MKSFIASFTDNSRRLFILGGFITLILFHISFVFLGFYGSDDINYARYAADIANNGIGFDPASYHFQLRWAPVYVTAFFYKIFGINAFTSTLFSATSVALCGYLIYRILEKEKPAILLLALTIFLFNYSILFYMHRIMPDPGVCLAVLWMYYCYRSYFLHSKKVFFYSLCFALALLLAVVTKESIVIALPLFAVFFIKDIYKKQNLLFWKYAAGFSLLFVFLYLLYFKITTGDFFFRYHLLQTNAYENICSFQDLPLINTLERIGYKLWLAIFLNGDISTLLPAVAAIIYRNKVLPVASKNTDAFSFAFLLLSANFMSISFTHYVPLCHDPRHFMFIFPFAAIIGGPMLFAYFKEPSKFIWLPVIYIAATFIMLLIPSGNNKYFLLLFTLLLCAHYFISFFTRKTFIYKAAIFFFVLLFGANYIKDFVKPPYPFYADHKKIIDEFVAGKQSATTVFSEDALSAEISEYFMGFKTGDIKFLPMDSIKENTAMPAYYLINQALNAGAKQYLDSLMKANKDTSFTRINHSNTVSLYKVNTAFLWKLKSR